MPINILHCHVNPAAQRYIGGQYSRAVVDAVKDQFETDNDDAVAAFWLFQSAKDGLFDFIKQGNHYKRLATKGLEEDIRFCCSLNKTDALPMLIDGKLVNNSI